MCIKQLPSFPPCPQPLLITNLLSLSVDLPILDISCNTPFVSDLLSLNMFSRFTHVACISTSVDVFFLALTLRVTCYTAVDSQKTWFETESYKIILPKVSDLKLQS